MRRSFSRKTVSSGSCRAVPGIPGVLHVSFDQLTSAEWTRWLAEMVTWLEQKMQREQSYLARRQARGVYTPTDEAYTRDTVYERAVLGFLHEMEQIQQEEGC